MSTISGVFSLSFSLSPVVTFLPEFNFNDFIVATIRKIVRRTTGAKGYNLLQATLLVILQVTFIIPITTNTFDTFA